MTHPARCPGCGAAAVDVLFADIHCPVYACGWYAISPRPCVGARHPDPDNVERVTLADARELLHLMGLVDIAIVRSAQ